MKVIVITGATAGLGRAIVHEFAKENVSLAILARDQTRLDETKKEVESLGSQAMTFSLDLASHEEIEKAAQAIEEAFGPIDLWINNAMVSVFSPAHEMTAQEYERVTQVTYLSVVYGTLSALKRMRKRGEGMIIQVGSALAYRGIPLQSAYCGAKHAIQGFTESVRCELMHDKSKIKITMVQMPAMNTPQFNWVKSRLPRKPKPVPPIFQPEVGARAVVWASKHYRREWVVGGPTLQAMLVDKFAPGFGDWYLSRQGYEAQQYNGQDDPNRPHNLFEAPQGNFGAHGDFDRDAKNHSLQFWFTSHRGWVLAVVVILFIAILFI